MLSPAACWVCMCRQPQHQAHMRRKLELHTTPPIPLIPRCAPGSSHKDAYGTVSSISTWPLSLTAGVPLPCRNRRGGVVSRSTGSNALQPHIAAQPQPQPIHRSASIRTRVHMHAFALADDVAYLMGDISDEHLYVIMSNAVRFRSGFWQPRPACTGGPEECARCCCWVFT